MRKTEIVLAALAPANGMPHTPVQVQKLLFLIDRNIAEVVGGPYFEFQPYNYGPFDKRVYEILERLAAEGCVRLVPHHTWTDYALTPRGQEIGDRLLAGLPDVARRYIVEASRFVRGEQRLPGIAFMTSVVGALCKDGVVVGSDSAATFVAGGMRTIEQPTEKLVVVRDHIIVAGTGQVGL
jgi:hypothetical protein